MSDVQNELKLFYTAFIDTGKENWIYAFENFLSYQYCLGKLSDEALSGLTEASYNAMTANGDVKLRKGWDDSLTLLPLMERVENPVLNRG